jgi:hypothetical protein
MVAWGITAIWGVRSSRGGAGMHRRRSRAVREPEGRRQFVGDPEGRERPLGPAEAPEVLADQAPERVALARGDPAALGEQPGEVRRPRAGNPGIERIPQRRPVDEANPQRQDAEDEIGARLGPGCVGPVGGPSHREVPP